MTDIEEFQKYLHRIHAGGWHPDSIPGRNAKAEIDEFVRRLKYEAWNECYELWATGPAGDFTDRDENPYN